MLPLVGGWLCGPAVEARGDSADDVVAVYSSVSPAYTRARLAGGAIKPETYAFGEGGSQGGTIRDSSLDRLRFIDVARVVAPALASAHYLPCDRTDPRQTDLLIMVYWGATVGTDETSSAPEYQIAQSLRPPPLPPSREERIDPRTMLTDACDSENGRIHADARALLAEMTTADSELQQSLTLMSMANRQRDRQNFENASVLGFAPDLVRYHGELAGPAQTRHQDLIDEISESRYYVVLMAYDFQSMLQRKEKKLLWQTRFSIRQRRNDFSEQLAAMTQLASHYFGQSTGGMRRQSLPDGHVDLGEPKPLGTVPEGK